MAGVEISPTFALLQSLFMSTAAILKLYFSPTPALYQLYVLQLYLCGLRW